MFVTTTIPLDSVHICHNNSKSRFSSHLCHIKRYAICVTIFIPLDSVHSFTTTVPLDSAHISVIKTVPLVKRSSSWLQLHAMTVRQSSSSHSSWSKLCYQPWSTRTPPATHHGQIELPQLLAMIKQNSPSYSPWSNRTPPATCHGLV